MRNTNDLFPRIPKIRKRPGILMHYTDVGINDCCGEPIVANMKCKKCGYEKWMKFKNATEVKRGIQCPICNTTYKDIP